MLGSGGKYILGFPIKSNALMNSSPKHPPFSSSKPKIKQNQQYCQFDSLSFLASTLVVEWDIFSRYQKPIRDYLCLQAYIVLLFVQVEQNMGCMNSSASSQRYPQHPHIYKYLQIMKLDHPLNVNKKYQHICKIMPDLSIGDGLRKTCAYECLTTEADFYHKRKQFWETRTSGSKQLWSVIQKCLTMGSDDDIHAQFDNYGIMALNNSVQMCVDYNFIKYDIPIFCINMPTKFADKLPAEKNLKANFRQQTLNVKIRSTKFPIDTTLTIPNTLLVEELKSQYLTLVGLGLDEYKVRLFYNGQEMLQGYPIGSFCLKQSHVMQAMISKV